MAGTTIVVGDVYDIDRPGAAVIRGRIVTALQSTPLPHIWVEILQFPPERNPALLVIGPGVILIPAPPEA